MQFVLAANDEQHAQTLLDLLLDQNTPGIEVASLSSEVQCPFRYFWLVKESRPSILILERAARVWWRVPDDDGLDGLQIFQEWGHCLDVPHDILARIHWGADPGLLLLSRSAPERIVVDQPDNTSTKPLLSVAKVYATPIQTVQTVATEPVEFDVTIGLIDNSAASQLDQLVLDLGREIRGKELILERLQRKSSIESQMFEVSEPLLAFVAPPGVCPQGIRRLLVEWTDYEEDLGALRYAKFPTFLSTTNAQNSVTETHVVLTDRALFGTKKSGRGTGLMLRTYGRPTYGLDEMCHHFELAYEWVGYGLQMFLPNRCQFEFSPRFDPGPVAAEKLRTAFNLTDDQIVLVSRTGTGKTVLYLIPKAAFQPFRSEFEWECNLPVQVLEPNFNEVWSSKKRDQLLDSIGCTFDDALSDELCARLKPLEAEFSSSVMQAENIVSGLALFVKQWEEKVSHLGSSLDDVGEAQTQINWAIDQIKTIRSTISKIEGRPTGTLEKMFNMCADLLKRIGK